MYPQSSSSDPDFLAMRSSQPSPDLLAGNRSQLTAEEEESGKGIGGMRRKKGVREFPPYFWPGLRPCNGGD